MGELQQIWNSDWWKHLLEILILAVGIYYVASFVRGTRGAAIFTGTLVLLLALGLISNWLHLQVLRWLESHIVEVLAVVIAALALFFVARWLVLRSRTQPQQQKAQASFTD